MLTGNKDSDRYILQQLEDDRDLLSACSVNKYALEVCNDTFFVTRIHNKYPNTMKYKPLHIGWKQYYLSTVYYINKMLEDYNFKYVDGDPKLYYDLLLKYSPTDLGNGILSTENIEKIIQGRYKSASYGYRDLLEYFINFMPWASESLIIELLEAARGGHKDLVDFIIKASPMTRNHIGIIIPVVDREMSNHLQKYIK